MGRDQRELEEITRAGSWSSIRPEFDAYRAGALDDTGTGAFGQRD